MEHIISELERENHNCDVHVMLWKQRRKVKLNLRYCHRGVAPWVGLEASLNARQLRVIYIKIYRHGGWGWMGAHGVFRNWWGIWDEMTLETGAGGGEKKWVAVSLLVISASISSIPFLTWMRCSLSSSWPSRWTLPSLMSYVSHCLQSKTYKMAGGAYDTATENPLVHS